MATRSLCTVCVGDSKRPWQRSRRCWNPRSNPMIARSNRSQLCSSSPGFRSRPLGKWRSRWRGTPKMGRRNGSQLSTLSLGSKTTAIGRCFRCEFGLRKWPKDFKALQFCSWLTVNEHSNLNSRVWIFFFPAMVVLLNTTWKVLKKFKKFTWTFCSHFIVAKLIFV